MDDSLDQIFVTLKHAVVALAPEALQPLVSIVLSILPIIAVFPLIFALTTVIERKGLGRIQNRLGPNRVGPYGFLQFAADGIKSLTKEDIVPAGADRVVHFIAPFVLVVPVLLSYSVLPFGRNMTALDLSETGHTLVFKSASVTAGTDKPTPFTEAQLSALLSGYDTLAKASGSSAGTATLKFTAGSGVFDYLAVGESVTITYTVTAKDANGGEAARASPRSWQPMSPASIRTIVRMSSSAWGCSSDACIAWGDAGPLRRDAPWTWRISATPPTRP